MEPRPRIVYVDDEPENLDAFRRVFFREDYEILTATSGADGLKLGVGGA